MSVLQRPADAVHDEGVVGAGESFVGGVRSATAEHILVAEQRVGDIGGTSGAADPRRADVGRADTLRDKQGRHSAPPAEAADASAIDRAVDRTFTPAPICGLLARVRLGPGGPPLERVAQVLQLLFGLGWGHGQAPVALAMAALTRSLPARSHSSHAC